MTAESKSSAESSAQGGAAASGGSHSVDQPETRDRGLDPRKVGTPVRRVLRGYAVVGLAMCVGLVALAYTHISDQAARAICGSGATASLLGAVVALNLSDRIRRRRPLYLFWAALLLVSVSLGLIAVSVMALERNIWGAWSPFLGAAFLMVLAMVVWRLGRQAA